MNFVMYQAEQAINQSIIGSNRVWQDEQNHLVLIETMSVPSQLKTELKLKSIELESHQWLELFQLFSEKGWVRDVVFDSEVVTSRTHAFAYHMTYKKTDELLQSLRKLMFVQFYSIERLILKMANSNGEINLECNSNATLKVTLPPASKNEPSYDQAAVYNIVLGLYEEIAKVLLNHPVEFKERR